MRGLVRTMAAEALCPASLSPLSAEVVVKVRARVRVKRMSCGIRGADTRLNHDDLDVKVRSSDPPQTSHNENQFKPF
eukprot:evm.model.NODE_18326_length_4385_cov_17.529989.1